MRAIRETPAVAGWPLTIREIGKTEMPQGSPPSRFLRRRAVLASGRELLLCSACLMPCQSATAKVLNGAAKTIRPRRFNASRRAFRAIIRTLQSITIIVGGWLRGAWPVASSVMNGEECYEACG